MQLVANWDTCGVVWEMVVDPDSSSLSTWYQAQLRFSVLGNKRVVSANTSSTCFYEVTETYQGVYRIFKSDSSILG